MAEDKSAKNIRDIGDAGREASGGVDAFADSVADTTGRITFLNETIKALQRVLPFDDLVRMENMLTRTARVTGDNTNQIRAQQREIRTLSAEYKIFAQEDLARTISQLRTLSPLMSSALVDVQRLTNLGFKAGHEQGQQYVQAIGQMSQSMPHLIDLIQETTNAQGLLATSSAGMTDALRAGGVEGLAVYNQMRLAAAGVSDTSGEFRIFGDIVDTFSSSFKDALLPALQSFSEIMRTLRPLIEPIAQLMGTMGAFGVVGAGLGAVAGRVGGGARPRGGMTGGMGGMSLSSAVINVGTATITTGMGGAGGRGRGGRGGGMMGTPEQASRFSAFGRFMMSPLGIGLLGGGLQYGAGMLGPGGAFGVRRQQLQGTIGGATLGAQVGSLAGPGGLIAGGLIGGAAGFYGGREQAPTATQRIVEEMGRTRLATRDVYRRARIMGETPTEAGLTGLEFEAGSLQRSRGKLEARGGALPGLIREQEQMEIAAGDLARLETRNWWDKINPLQIGKRGAAGRVGLEARAERGRLEEEQGENLKEQLNVEAEIVKNAEAQRQRRMVLIDISQREVDVANTRLELAFREGDEIGKRRELQSGLVEELKEQLQVIDDQVRKTKEQKQTLDAMDVDTVSLTQDLAKFEQQRLNVRNQMIAAQGQIADQQMTELGFQERAVRAQLTIAKAMHDPMMQQLAVQKQLSVEMAKQDVLRAKAAALPVGSIERQEIETQILEGQGRIAQTMDLARRTWEDVFTEQVMGLPTGSYLVPTGPSGLEQFGPAFMTGMRPEQQAAAMRGGFGTLEQQVREIRGRGADAVGRTGWEGKLSSILNGTTFQMTLDSETGGSLLAKLSGAYEMMQDVAGTAGK